MAGVDILLFWFIAQQTSICSAWCVNACAIFFSYYSEGVVVDPIERIDPAVVKATAFYTDHAPPISIRFFFLLLHSHSAFSYFFIFRATWINRLLHWFQFYIFYLNELNDPNIIYYGIFPWKDVPHRHFGLFRLSSHVTLRSLTGSIVQRIEITTGSSYI